MFKGIDVSSYQGKIDWEDVKRYIDFAIIRLGYGNNVISQDDSRYEENSRECERLNIPYGVYLYSYATNLSMIESEVRHTLRLIKDKKLEYPIFIDIEDRSQLRLPKDELVNIVKYYCEKIEEAGYYVGIYASLNTLNTILDSSILDRYDKWVAEWGKDFNYKGESGMWQYTDNEVIPGIKTRVDGDKAFYNYPEIIRKNGLNHLDDTVNLKYSKGDTVYLNGTLYRNKDGKEEIRNYRNKKVVIEDTDNQKGTVAPYKLNINGYSKEDDLSDSKIKYDSKLKIIIECIKKAFNTKK